MKCIKCGSENRRKNGLYQGVQKWQCRDCGHTSCRTSPRGAPPEIIRLALTLVLEGMGFCAAARVLTSFGYKCSENAIIQWVKKYGATARTIHSATKTTARVVQIDEMYSYVKKSRANAGCGWLLMAIPAVKSPRVLVIDLPPHCAN